MIVVHEMFPGRRAFIPSNPVKRETVPCYAASERQAEMSLTSRSGGQRAGFRRADSLESVAGEAGERQTGRGPHAGLSAGGAVLGAPPPPPPPRPPPRHHIP